MTTEIRKYPKMNENENIIYQNLREAAKAVLQGKCIGPMAVLKKDLKSQLPRLFKCLLV